MMRCSLPSISCYLARLLLIFGLLIGGASGIARADQAAFQNWLAELRVEALARGIDGALFDAALAKAKPIERVVTLDRNQPEFKLTLARYLQKVVPQSRKDIAIRKFNENSALLGEVSAAYDVQARYIIALWGIETSFGKHLGGFDVPVALATLAYDGRRSAYFRKELLNALQILQEGHAEVGKMKGSWAGAMGQSQFMPSSFLAYAEDWDKDGRRDIWTTRSDVFASIANYLKKAGWRSDMTWGREVRLPAGLSDAAAMALYEDKQRQELPVWAQMGFVNPDGSVLPTRPLTARLVLPDGPEGRAFLVYANYDAILRWNRSNYFAIAVGQLSDAMR